MAQLVPNDAAAESVLGQETEFAYDELGKLHEELTNAPGPWQQMTEKGHTVRRQGARSRARPEPTPRLPPTDSRRGTAKAEAPGPVPPPGTVGN